jgi:hypothetical protein
MGKGEYRRKTGGCVGFSRPGYRQWREMWIELIKDVLLGSASGAPFALPPHEAPTYYTL